MGFLQIVNSKSEMDIFMKKGIINIRIQCSYYKYKVESFYRQEGVARSY